jgi:hypothetical protein
MNIKPIFTIPIMLVLLTAFGCTEAKPTKSSAIERATSKESILTSTVSPEPAVPEIAKAPPPEEKVEEPRPFEAALESMDGLTIKRLVTAPEVEHREPIAASAIFGHQDERVYAFVEVSNESEEEKTLWVHFIGPEGHVSGGIELHIPPAVPRWRTWAHTRHAKKPGLWRVEIRTVDGGLIGALPFEVEPAY